MKKQNKYIYVVFLVMALLLINWLASMFHQRFDLTQDQRYTLSPAAREIIAEVKSPL
ncbi:hypothetical protein [Antarcticibacterium arcticum]|uniref:hypothetical protein n=1 Tax=Antarcticibacterium arcticum TaxID=2585771 RepID=UPI0029392626|nr:hypothetical protein [Antarcticibacterium arcticum]